MARKKLGANDLLLLRALAQGPAQVETLKLDLAASSRYYSAGKLVELGLATHDPRLNQHVITPEGEKLLAERGLLDREPRSKPRILSDEVWSRLSALSDAHIRFLELIQCAVAIRWHRIFTTNLPTFAVLGEPQGGKSTVLKLAIALAGGEIKTDFIYLPKEKGQSLTVRVDARGVRVSEREVLKHPVFGGDEILKSKPEIKDAVKHQFGYGESVLADENGELEFLCTPVVSMNPHKEGSTLEDRTEFSEDQGEQRRTVFLDLTRVPISDAFLIAGQDILKSIEPLGPAEPPCPPKPYPDSRKRVMRTLRKVVTADRRKKLKGIDIVLISQLVVGATAYVPSQEEAFRAVIWAWATLASLLGLLVPEWSTILEVEFSKERIEADEDDAEDGDSAVDADELTRVRVAWENVVKRVFAAGYTAEDVDRLVAYDERLKEAGSSTETAVELDDTRRSLQFNLTQAKNALLVRREAADVGIGLGDLRALVQDLAADAAQTPHGYPLAEIVHAIVNEHGSLSASIEKLRAEEAMARAESEKAWSDNASIRRYFREVHRVKEKMRRAPELKPLVVKVDAFMGEWVRSISSEDAAEEGRKELERLCHWLVTLRAEIEAFENEPARRELAKKVDRIVEKETLEQIMAMVEAQRRRAEARAARPRG